MPPPGVAVWTGPLSDTPRGVSAWAIVGQVAAPVVTAAVVVVCGGAVVAAAEVVAADAEVVGLADGPLDPQPVTTRPATRAPMTRGVRLGTGPTIGPGSGGDK